jgi:hypothetical protein
VNVQAKKEEYRKQGEGGRGGRRAATRLNKFSIIHSIEEMMYCVCMCVCVCVCWSATHARLRGKFGSAIPMTMGV